MNNQNDFLIGCLIGGLLGALSVAAYANYGDELKELAPAIRKRGRFLSKYLNGVKKTSAKRKPAKHTVHSEHKTKKHSSNHSKKRVAKHH